MASILSRNGVIWVSLYQDGRRIRKSTKLADTKENRKRVEKELLPMLEKQDFTPKKTVGYYYQLMMKQKNIRASTLERYACHYDCHIKQFEDRQIDSIKVSELRQWVSSSSLSPKSVRGNMSVFRMIFQEALYDEAVSKNPFEQIRLPKSEKFEPEPFSTEEMGLLISNADGWFKNLLAVLFYTGMRIGEAIALEWDDIDEFIKIDKSIREGVVTATKTNNVRFVPVFNDLKPYIDAQRRETGLRGKRVFNGNGAKELKPRWHRLLKKCSMGHRILYQARHTFAIKALDSGMFKVSQIAKMLGHASVQMLFQKYAKFIRSEIDELPKDFSTLGTKKDTKVS